MAIYDDILDQIGTAPAAGQLHENIWVELLRREEPALHNVRLGRGDGGIDGHVLLDPLTGDAEVFQAKFNAVLGDDQKEEIVNSFVSAHRNTFVCAKWTLLLPIELSAPELNWLTVDMREAAKRVAADDAMSVRMNACEIRYRDSTELVELLERNLDIAGRLLPRSALAIMERLVAERERHERLDREVASILREMRRDATRRREIETRRALAALGDLWLGWSDFTAAFGGLARTGNRVRADELELHCREFDRFAEEKLPRALECEGIAKGVSERVRQLRHAARMLLLQAMVMRQGQIDGASVAAAVERFFEEIDGAQRAIATLKHNLIDGVDL